MEPTLEAQERVLEEEMTKFKLMPYLRQVIKNTLPTLDTKILADKVAVDALAFMLFHKRALIVTLVGSLLARFKDLNLVLTVLDDLVQNKDLLDCTGDTFVTKLTLDQHTNDRLSQLLYPLPMVIPPKRVTRNTDSGYHYLGPQSLVLKNKFFSEDINLEHINRVNSIALRLNEDVVNDLVNTHDKPFESQQDYNNWVIFVKQQREILDFYRDHEFYLTHKYDKRGRVYCQGYHISYQSTDFTNGCIEFAQGEPVV